VVIIKNLNDTEVLDFVDMTKDLPISVRFIEFMPFTGQDVEIFTYRPVEILMVLKETSGTKRRWCRRLSFLNESEHAIQTYNALRTS